VSADDRRLLLEAAALLMLVRAGLRLLPFPVCRHLLDRYAEQGTRSPAPGIVPRVVWAVGAAGRRLPGRTTCLADALVADAMLRRRRCASEIRFGVRPRQRPGRLDAHAWVEHEGRIVLGAVDQLSTYARLNQSRPR
jgi:hypothetical protein